MAKRSGFFSESELARMRRVCIRPDPYQRYFDDYNRKYFENKLLHYHVWTAWRPSWANGYRDRCVLGSISYDERIIRLQKRQGCAQMLSTLLHEMAHAAVPEHGHGLQWKAEMQRLHEVGAFGPLSLDDVIGDHEYGESSKPWPTQSDRQRGLFAIDSTGAEVPGRLPWSPAAICPNVKSLSPKTPLSWVTLGQESQMTGIWDGDKWLLGQGPTQEADDRSFPTESGKLGRKDRKIQAPDYRKPAR